MVPAKKIMTTEVITVSPETPIFRAMAMLSDHAISGLPVVDKENKLLGIMTEKDVLKILVTSNIGASEKVEDYMTRNVVSFDEESSATTICEFFMKNPIRRVPIVKDGRLTGIVSRRDIIRLILETHGKISRIS